MAVFYKILRNLALILFHRLGKKINGELLLVQVTGLEPTRPCDH